MKIITMLIGLFIASSLRAAEHQRSNIEDNRLHRITCTETEESITYNERIENGNGYHVDREYTCQTRKTWAGTFVSNCKVTEIITYGNMPDCQEIKELPWPESTARQAFKKVNNCFKGDPDAEIFL